ncbi:MAG: caspase domain-containing protein [Beijerinckiaceae bacterium]
MRRLWTLAFGLALWSLTHTEALADRRVALVIGNGAYAHSEHLPNPPHDAEDVAAALKRVGFDTILGTDLDQAGMQDAAIRFARAARAADVAVFYYSGHAMQFAGVNYLVPVDAQLRDEADLRRMAKVDDIVADLQQAKTLRILVLDSCRDNPLAEQLKRSIGASRAVSVQRGLAKIDSPEGMIISYATLAGRTAEDGNGRNSPYTAAFLKHIEEQDEIGTIFRRVAADVYESTGREQLPELSLSVIGEFYLRGRLDIDVPARPPADRAQPLDAETTARADYALAKQAGTLAAWDAFLAHHPTGFLADLARGERQKLSEPYKEQQARLPPAPEIPPQVQNPTVTTWTHNGSTVILKAQGAERQFYYESPRPGLASIGVRKGTLLFSGKRTGDSYAGVAYIFNRFNRACPPHPYQVTGSVSNDQRSVTLYGKAPLVDSDCKVTNYKEDVLTFSFNGK